MPSLTFADYQLPVVSAAWLNDINTAVYAYAPPDTGAVTATLYATLNKAWIGVTATDYSLRNGGAAQNAWFVRRDFGAVSISQGAGTDGFSYSPRTYMWDTDEEANVSTNFFVASQFRHFWGGSNSYGGRIGLYSTLEQQGLPNIASAQPNFVAAQASNYVNYGDRGTNTGAGAKGGFFGGGSAIYVEGAAQNLLNVTAHEFDTFIKAGASVKYQFGLQVAGANAQRGAGFDAAIAVSGITDAIAHAGYGVGLFFASWGGAEPFTATSTMIAAVTSSGASMQHAIDVSTYIVTGKLLKGMYSSLSETQLIIGDSGGNGIISMGGPSTDSNLAIRSKGTGSVSFQTDAGLTMLRADRVASSVNFTVISPSATGVPVGISATGTDAAVSLYLQRKGTGAIMLDADAYANDAAAAAGGVPVKGIYRIGNALQVRLV